MKPVALLDAYEAPSGGASFFVPFLQARPVAVVRIVDGELPGLDEVGAVVITGSAASVLDEAPWMTRAASWVGAAVAADVPVLGACWGHQLLARAVWGPGAVGRQVPPEVGYVPVRLWGDDPLFGVLGDEVRCFVTHEDRVVPQPGMEVLGASDACPVHALRVPGRRAWGYQFHVEYPPHEQERILRWRAERHPELGLDVDTLLACAPDTEATARRLLGRFLELSAVIPSGP